MAGGVDRRHGDALGVAPAVRTWQLFAPRARKMLALRQLLRAARARARRASELGLKVYAPRRAAPRRVQIQ